jgi:hypothetical protein
MVTYATDLLFVARIASSSKSHNVKLKGVIETDEFYIMIGLKARPYHDKVFNCGRLPRDRRAHGMAIIISDEPQHQRMDSSDSLNFH